jgi:crossover junction endodeoxyribonuclease RuvC
LVRLTGGRLTCLTCGAVRTHADEPFAGRLLSIAEHLEQLIETWQPHALAVEELFFSRNTTTAIGTAQARGVAILCGAKAGLPVYEYTPAQVKCAVSGYGKADKQQVQQMVRILLGLQAVPKPDDAADALAVAICHAHSGDHAGALAKGGYT